MSGGRVPFDDPGWLDTLTFAGASETQIRRLALASRPGLSLHDDPLGLVRVRRGDIAADRPALVFLPDAPATVESYDELFAHLAPRWNVAALEIPGFGYSWPRSPAALEFGETVRLSPDALAALELGPAILVGPCVQAFVAIAIARTRPASAFCRARWHRSLRRSRGAAAARSRGPVRCSVESAPAVSPPRP